MQVRGSASGTVRRPTATFNVRQTIAGEDKRSYTQAVRLIDETIRPLFTECGKPDDYEGYLDEIRSRHRPKRNLMKLMDQLQTRPGARA